MTFLAGLGAGLTLGLLLGYSLTLILLHRSSQAITAAVEKTTRVVAYPVPPAVAPPEATEAAELGRDVWQDEERVPSWMGWEAGDQPEEAKT